MGGVGGAPLPEFCLVLSSGEGSWEMFHEIRSPIAIAFHSTGGPQRKTEIVVLGSGFEERNAVLAGSRSPLPCRLWRQDAGRCARGHRFLRGAAGAALRFPLQGFFRLQILSARRCGLADGSSAGHRRRHDDSVPTGEDLYLRPVGLDAHDQKTCRRNAAHRGRGNRSDQRLHTRYHHRPCHLRRRASVRRCDHRRFRIRSADALRHRFAFHQPRQFRSGRNPLHPLGGGAVAEKIDLPLAGRSASETSRVGVVCAASPERKRSGVASSPRGGGYWRSSP